MASSIYTFLFKRKRFQSCKQLCRKKKRVDNNNEENEKQIENHEERSPVDIAEHITLGRATFHFLWTGSCEEFRHGRLTDQQANLICLIALLVPFHPFLFLLLTLPVLRRAITALNHFESSTLLAILCALFFSFRIVLDANMEKLLLLSKVDNDDIEFPAINPFLVDNFGIETMEENGIVTPMNSNGSREVL